METLKIAITGASGFVGANLTTHFSKSHDVYALTRNINGWRLASTDAIPFDVANRSKVFKVLKKIKPDILIHCAVYGGYHFENNVRDVINTNIIGTLNVLNACDGISLFINTGSSSEYGIKYKSMNETDTTEPRSNYAMSKVLITNMLQSVNPKAITMRLFSAYGYYEEKHRLIPYLLYSAIKGEKAKLSNRNSVRDFVFIEDISCAYELAIRKQNKLKRGEIFNVGSGKQTYVEDVAKSIGAKVEWTPGIRVTEPHMRWQADISKIKGELGWKPRNTLEQGLIKTKLWMEDNITLYEDERNDKKATGS